VEYPVLCSPKLDGIRCVKINGRVLARSLKPIKNNYIRTTLERLLPDGIDGELMSGDTFQACTSAIMSEDGEPAFKLWCFDYVFGENGLERKYNLRVIALKEEIEKIHDDRVAFVPVKQINNEKELLAYEAEMLSQGFEGVMLRNPIGPYKCGRSTEKEGWLLKLKRFVDSEAEIIGFEELMHNNNEKKINELGLSHRSSAKAGKTPGGTLGKFLVRDLNTKVEGRIGTGEGLTQKLRQQIWDNRSTYMGKIVKYRFQAIGVKDKARIPVFIGFRDEIDL
jgi:DNA ligase-1